MNSSSDLDEDRPILQKLQKLKKKFRAQTEPKHVANANNSLNETIDLCEISSFEIRTPVSNDVIVVPDLDKNYDSTRLFLDDSVIICEDDEDIPTQPRKKAKRSCGRGRGRKGQGKELEIPVTSEAPSGSVRGKGKVRGKGRKGQGKELEIPVTSEAPSGSVRGKGKVRGRGRKGQVKPPQALVASHDDLSPVIAHVSHSRWSTRNSTNRQPSVNVNVNQTPSRGSRGRKSARIAQLSSYPTYSVGNTDEYPDASCNQQLFTNKPNDSTIIDLSESLDNEELSVKVYWQSMEVIKFNIRKLQKLTQIFDHFAKQEGVERNQLLFTYNNKILRPDDTPESIGYNIGKFIDGGIIDSEFLPTIHAEKKSAPKGFLLKFQCQSLKKPFELSVVKDEKLQLAMIKCAEHLELPITSLRFEFDGEAVRGNVTPKDLDMESGDCIDVKILNVNK